jgi:hypothetical protein
MANYPVPGVALSAADLEFEMAHLIPRGDFYRQKSLSDEEILHVKDLLFRAGKRAWSYRPQIYAVLRMIDCLDLMQAFIVEGLSDDQFPYRRETLPPEIVTDHDACELFLNRQWLVVGKIGAKEKLKEGNCPGKLIESSFDVKESLRLVFFFASDWYFFLQDASFVGYRRSGISSWNPNTFTGRRLAKDQTPATAVTAS